MPDSMILPEEIHNQLIKVKEDILSGKIYLLELELNPIFQSIKDSVSKNNIFQYSQLFKETYLILNQKFEELKSLLMRMDNEQKFIKYLETNPKDLEIAVLYEGCWNGSLQVESLSFEYLQMSRNRLLNFLKEPINIKELSRLDFKDQFFLEIPKLKFTEKMNEYLQTIIDKLPCQFGDIFENEKDQMLLYEHFIFLLHLLQLGKIKYQKETKTLYI